jgi:hypothetical protein
LSFCLNPPRLRRWRARCLPDWSGKWGIKTWRWGKGRRWACPSSSNPEDFWPVFCRRWRVSCVHLRFWAVKPGPALRSLRKNHYRCLPEDRWPFWWGERFDGWDCCRSRAHYSCLKFWILLWLNMLSIKRVCSIFRIWHIGKNILGIEDWID